MSRRGQLDLLLRLRELGERRARTRLGEASAVQAQAERRVRDLEEAIDALPMHEHLTTREFRSVMAAQHAMATLVLAARQEALATAAATAQAREAWLDAARDREGMARLVARPRPQEQVRYSASLALIYAMSRTDRAETGIRPIDFPRIARRPALR